MVGAEKDMAETARGVACRILAEGSDVDGNLWLGSVPTKEEKAVVRVNGKTLAVASTETRSLWRARSAGSCTVEHSVGDVTISAAYRMRSPACYETASSVACQAQAAEPEIDGEQGIGAAPTDAARAVVTVNGVEVFCAAMPAHGRWRPRARGVQTVAHSAGDVTVAAEYEVTAVVCEAMARPVACRVIANGTDFV